MISAIHYCNLLFYDLLSDDFDEIEFANFGAKRPRLLSPAIEDPIQTEGTSEIYIKKEACDFVGD